MTRTTYNGPEGLSVTVEDAGSTVPPWARNGRRDFAYHYTLTVSIPDPSTGGDTVYRSPGWGSIADAEAGKRDHGGMAGMILGEVFSAYSDPEEFWRMAAEGWTGPGIPERAEVTRLFDLIATAEIIGPVIERALRGTDGYAEVPEDLDGVWPSVEFLDDGTPVAARRPAAS